MGVLRILNLYLSRICLVLFFIIVGGYSEDWCFILKDKLAKAPRTYILRRCVPCFAELTEMRGLGQWELTGRTRNKLREGRGKRRLGKLAFGIFLRLAYRVQCCCE